MTDKDQDERELSQLKGIAYYYFFVAKNTPYLRPVYCVNKIFSRLLER